MVQLYVKKNQALLINMPVTKKNKVAIGASVGAVVLAAAIGVTIYFIVKKKPAPGPGPGPGPGPSGTTWTCVDDGQGSSMLLSNGTPCAKFTSDTLCQAAASAGTLTCPCPTSQVSLGSSGACTSICLDTATWDSVQNICVCPTNTQFDPASGKCVQKPCSPQVTVDESSGAVTGFFRDSTGKCVDSTLVTGVVPQLNTLCQSTACQVPTVCTTGMVFSTFNSSTHACVPPDACTGQPYYYIWPDGANTCPGLTYSTGADSKCVPPDNNALKVACEYSAGGCPTGTQPLQQGEVCSSGSGSCRAFNDTPTCPSGSVVNMDQCSTSGKGVCYNSSTGACTPAQYNCVSAGLPCPADSELSSSCSSSSIGPCLNTQNQCVPTLVGCRPDTENWSFDNNVCTNVTSVTGLQLSLPSNLSSNVNSVYVNATVPASYKQPLTSLQFRYVLVSDSTTYMHWSGVVSSVQVSSTNHLQATLTFYPDQSVNPVPSNVTLKLFVIGMVQSFKGSWVASISSANLNDSSVFTLQLASATPSCLPTVGFSANQALQLVPTISTLSSTQQTVAITPAAAAIGLSAAASTAYAVGGSFAGAVVPLATLPVNSQTVSHMFVVLAWTSLENPPGPVTYVVNQNNVPVYSGPLTKLVDVVNVNSVTSVTYSVQAQTSDNCTSPLQYTTCPPLEYQGAMCTSLTNGSSSVTNFLIPDPNGPGCTSIPSTDLVDAAYYACAYLKNKNRSLAGLQVPSSPDYTQCLSVVPVTNAVVVKPLNQNTDSNNKPTGFCTDASCTAGYIETYRTAVCGCGGSATLCNSQKDVPGGLPYVQLVSSSGNVVQNMSASDFSTGMNGMANFMNRNPKLQF